MTTIAMTGADAGPGRRGRRPAARVPSGETPRIQEGHMLAAHIVCEWVEARLVAEAAAD